MAKGYKEDTRVQVPAVLHLTRLGYKYIGKGVGAHSDTYIFDQDTNILVNEFRSQFAKLNPGAESEFDLLLSDIRKELDNDDLGKKFYERITSLSPYKLIDFDNIKNNTYHVAAELTCKNGSDEFRPDITLFINGLPLVFIEVKQTNNPGGMLDESHRMNNQRFTNRKFRRFINITQLMIFSNNMEYNARGGIIPIEGVFYCSAARQKTRFNCFREENLKMSPEAPFNHNFNYLNDNPDTEIRLLKEFNAQMIRTSPEYSTNKHYYTPTNRVLTSMCSPERLLFLLKYGIAYVKSDKMNADGIIESMDEKHIMRYQQMFAALAVRKQLSEGVKSGIIWHTQGSGKTALSYHLTHVLRDYFASQGVVSKFYFIVDRLDLLEQASQEFAARGLQVHTANTRKELMAQFKELTAYDGNSGKDEITVVNIQRFAEDKSEVEIPSYNVKLQRVFIMDEAHRSYNPKGSFLANLFGADKDSIKIALTGTPLIGAERSSRDIFGSYINTYYYDKSIQDGYTLKIIREDIETSYKSKIHKVLTELENKQKEKDKASGVKKSLDELAEERNLHKQQIIEHTKYVKELTEYIVDDIVKFRILRDDQSLAGMVICETSGQAKKMFELFDGICEEKGYNLKAGLILHDQDDKETRKQVIANFKKNGTVDILIVFNMLLTGFDAPRLKRLYFGRKLVGHNLLQAITRVNRPYKTLQYGFVIDFADIKRNFEETNEEYMHELNKFSGNVDEEGEVMDVGTDLYRQVMEDSEMLIEQMKHVHDTLMYFTIDNAEEFDQQISEIDELDKLHNIRSVLETARDTYNLVNTFGNDEIKETFKKMSIEKLPLLLQNINRRINAVNIQRAITGEDAGRVDLNEVMMQIEFDFSKIGEDELRIIDGGSELVNIKNMVVQTFTDIMDPEDKQYLSLLDQFKKIMSEHGFKTESMASYNEQKKALNEIHTKLKQLQQRNKAILSRYNSDSKFLRIHKRILEYNEENTQKPLISKSEFEICNFLRQLKEAIDQKVYDKNDILKQDEFFAGTVAEQIVTYIESIPNVTYEYDDILFIQERVVKQYVNEYREYYTPVVKLYGTEDSAPGMAAEGGAKYGK